jgi:septum formation protein
MNRPQIYLASRSPRRRELLDQIGVRYRVVTADLDESRQRGESPRTYVTRLARDKAWAGYALANEQLPVLAADTAVVVDGQTLGKPEGQAHALSMLRMLSGRTHQVLTAVVVRHDKEWSALSCSRVTFRCIAPHEALAYWQSGEPADKAGGYGIQGLGALFIERLEGSFSGVMGLPLFETAQLLNQAGLDPLAAGARGETV